MDLGATSLLVTGAEGMVGNYAIRAFDVAGHPVPRMLLVDRQPNTLALPDWADALQRDITHPDVVHAFENEPSVVIHLAAATDVDGCETDLYTAYRTNVYGTENIVRECLRQTTPPVLVYVSTAGVFNGQKAAYHEWDEPNPVNVYGRSKLAAERFVRENYPKHYIVRAGWMFGGGLRDKKFVRKITHQLLSGQTVYAVTDKRGSPTYGFDLLRGIRRLLVHDAPFGTYHMTNSGSGSRYDVAAEIGREVGMLRRIEETTSGRFHLAADRAPSEVLLDWRSRMAGIPAQPDWQISLRAYVREELVPALRTQLQSE